MRLTIRKLRQKEHQVVIIGGLDEAQQLKDQGIPVVGSLSGVRNKSKTLHKRLLSYIQKKQYTSSDKILAWGWHATAIVSMCELECDVYGFIDEVDCQHRCDSGLTIIPTSEASSRAAMQMGLHSSCIGEQIIGVEPTSMVVNRTEALELLNFSSDTLLVSIIGDMGSWKDIISMAIRLRAAKQKALFVIPRTYRDHSKLVKSAMGCGIHDMVQEMPLLLRQVDVIHVADCAWCPAPAPYNSSCGVLDILSAAWEETPLAIGSSHPVATLPAIGSQLAWARDDIEVCGWMLDIGQDSDRHQHKCALRVETVRSIATPSRFIDGLQMRLYRGM